LSQFTKDFTRQLRPTDIERSSARAENKGNRNLSDGTVTRYDEGKSALGIFHLSVYGGKTGGRTDKPQEKCIGNDVTFFVITSTLFA